jgi:hypothetical protein
MLHRLTAGTIGLFWLAMMALLARTEFGGASRGLYEVPAAHVFNLMHRQGQDSRLGIFHGNDRVGNLVVVPEGESAEHFPRFGFYGGIQFPGTTGGNDRLHWSGKIAMTPQGTAGDFELRIRLREPALQFELKGDPAGKQIAYALSDGDRSLLSGSIPLGANGLPQLPWRQLGMAAPPALPLPPAPEAKTALVAKRCRITIRGEKIDAYRIGFDQGDTRVAEITISQVGQVLSATSAFGYSLQADDLLFQMPDETEPRPTR